MRLVLGLLHVPMLILVAGLVIPPSATAQDAIPGFPFKDGDVVGFDEVQKLKSYLPPEFWEHREFFFFEGMELEIGPVQRPYEGNTVYEAATSKYKGQAKIGKDQSISNYTAGRPFENAIPADASGSSTTHCASRVIGPRPPGSSNLTSPSASVRNGVVMAGGATRVPQGYSTGSTGGKAPTNRAGAWLGALRRITSPLLPGSNASPHPSNSGA